MIDLTAKEKDALARGLLDTVVKECELHGMEFIRLPDKMQKLLQDIARAGMAYGAKVMMEAVTHEKDN